MAQRRQRAISRTRQAFQKAKVNSSFVNRDRNNITWIGRTIRKEKTKTRNLKWIWLNFKFRVSCLQWRGIIWEFNGVFPDLNGKMEVTIHR